MSYGGESTYAMVKVKILRCSKESYWYSHMVGQIVEARKQITNNEMYGGTTTQYQYLGHIGSPSAYYFMSGDVEEVK